MLQYLFQKYLLQQQVRSDKMNIEETCTALSQEFTEDVVDALFLEELRKMKLLRDMIRPSITKDLSSSPELKYVMMVRTLPGELAKSHAQMNLTYHIKECLRSAMSNNLMDSDFKCTLEKFSHLKDSLLPTILGAGLSITVRSQAHG